MQTVPRASVKQKKKVFFFLTRFPKKRILRTISFFFWFAMQECPSPRKRVIVGFYGKAGSGKTTAANHLVAQGFVRGKFAGAIKEMVRALLRYKGVDAATVERMVESDLKEAPTPVLNGKSPRYVLQTLGTEFGRGMLGTDFWLDTEMEAKRDVPLLVFDDVRFANEAKAILAAGGIVVKLTRSAGPVLEHSSEAQSDVPFSHHIDNEASLDSFLRAVELAARVPQ
jgi:RecA/RadA recombinase